MLLQNLTKLFLILAVCFGLSSLSFSQQTDSKKGTFTISKINVEVKGYTISYYGRFREAEILKDLNNPAYEDIITSQYVRLNCLIDNKGSVKSSVLETNVGNEHVKKAFKLINTFAIPGMENLYANKAYVITVYY